MNMTANFYMCLFFILVLVSCRQAGDGNTYPKNEASIAMRLHEIDMELSDESQAKLGLFLEDTDNRARKALAEGESLDSIARWYYPSVDTLAALLPPLERNDFILAGKGRSGIRNDRFYTSGLRWYVRDRDGLRLTERQVEQLLAWCDNVERMSVNKDAKPQELEQKVLLSLLDAAQMKRYYTRKNESSVKNETVELLKRMKAKRLYATATDSVNLYWQLYTYKLEQKVDWEFLRFINAGNDSIRQNEARLWAYRPMVLWQLDTCEPSSRARMLDIVCKREAIGLSSRISQALLTSYVRLQQDEFHHKYDSSFVKKEFDRRKLENEDIVRLVPARLLDRYFKIITVPGVEKQAWKNWNALSEYELVNPADSTKVLKEMRLYETRLAIANQWIGLDRSRKNQFVKSDIINSKPALLKKLDEAKRKKRKEKIVQF